MRKTTTFLCAAILTVFSASTALAHPSDGDRPHQGPMKMFEQLDLSKQQRADVREVFKKNRDQFREHMKRMHDANTHLQEVMHDQKFNEAKVRDSARELAREQEELAVLRAKTSAEVRAFLTPEQRKKLDDKRAEMQQHFSERSAHWKKERGEDDE